MKIDVHVDRITSIMTTCVQACTLVEQTIEFLDQNDKLTRVWLWLHYNVILRAEVMSVCVVSNC